MTTDDRIHAAAAAAVAPGSRVLRVVPYRRNPVPFPAKLELSTAAGVMECVVKTAPADASRLGVEAAGLEVMREAGADAPRVLAAPQVLETVTGPVDFMVITPLPGQPLPWLSVSDVATADRTCRLLFQAIEGLHGLTDRVSNLPAGATIPRRTLRQELADVVARNSPWVETTLFDHAVHALDRTLSDHELPLVFSNGDYNPLNVLADDTGLTGWIDFEHVGFEDPLVGLPKFQFWADDSGWALGSQVGLVERYLHRHRIAPTTFAVRVVLRGLTHLHDSPLDQPPALMIETIEHAIATLRTGP